MRTYQIVVLLLVGLCAAPVAVAQDDPAADLAKALQAGDNEACVAACRELGELGPAAPSAAVQELSKAVTTSEDAEVQRWAILALAAMGPEAKDAVDALKSALQSPHTKVRAYAAHALGAIGPDASAAVEPLIALITDKDPAVRREARDAVRLIGAPKEAVLANITRILETADPADAASAVMTLAELGEAVVPGLCQALDNNDSCYWALLTLAELGPKAANAVPAVSKLLQHPEPEVRMQALVTLGEIGPAAKEQAGAISELLKSDPVMSVRYAAAFALGMVGGDAIDRSLLEQIMDSDDPFLKVAGAWVLVRTSKGPNPMLRKALRTIMQGLASDDANVRLAAANAVADSDAPAEFVAPAFEQLMTSLEKEAPERIGALLDTFASLGPKVLRPCVRSLEIKGPRRALALEVLMRLGPQAAPAVPALTTTLEDSDAALRREALFALGAIGPEAAPATEKIVSLLSDADETVAQAACYALGKIGPGAEAAVPALQQLTKSEDEFQRIAAVWALLKITPNDQELEQQAVPHLINALEDEREHVRVEAAYLLGEIGEPAKAAIPALEQARDDQSPAMQKAVATALDMLQ